MNDLYLLSLSLTEAANAIRSCKITPSELIAAYYRNIQFLDTKINAYIRIFEPEEYLQNSHNFKKKLTGIPIGIKDIFDIKGIPTTAAIRIPINFSPERNSAIVERLISQGAYMVGKHNLHSFAYGSTNLESVFGPVHNPWNLEKISGGSSGGSAAAVATSMCLAAIGSDTAGSLRIPAALCSVVGFKPTQYYFSLEGMLPISPTLDHSGILARTVDDAHYVFCSLIGCEDLPPNLEINQVSLGQVGVFTGDYFEKNIEESINFTFKSTLSDIHQVGGRIKYIHFPEMDTIARYHSVIMYYETFERHKKDILGRPEIFSSTILQKISTGYSISKDEYLIALRERKKWRKYFSSLFNEIQLIVYPTTALLATSIEGSKINKRSLIDFTVLANFLGFPSISLPSGFSRDKMPIGVEFLCNESEDEKLINFARIYEQINKWYEIRPPIFLNANLNNK